MTITIRSVPGDNGEDVLAYSVVGLPQLWWDEDRPSGNKRVSCKIGADDNGNLTFETNGSLLSDPVYFCRPWEKLVGFRWAQATDLYYSGVEKRLLQEVLNKLALLRIWGPDDGVVMLADFADDRPSIPMHLNYAVGTAVEITSLHNALYTRFIAQRRAVVDAVCDGEFKWPVESEESRAKIMVRVDALGTGIDNYNKRHGKSFWGKIFG